MIPQLQLEGKKSGNKSGKKNQNQKQTDSKIDQFELIAKLSSTMPRKLEYELWKINDKVLQK